MCYELAFHLGRPMPDEFSIREAAVSDIPILHALIERSVRSLQKDDYTPEQIEGAIGHALGLDTQLIADRTYFVAEAAALPAVIAGCGGWSNRATLFGSDHGPDRQGRLLDPGAEAAKIRAIFVDPDWARRGVGSLLLEHCEEAAGAAGFHRLEMGSTLTGVRLYTRRGYRAGETVDVPLPNGIMLPIIRMTKEI